MRYALLVLLLNACGIHPVATPLVDAVRQGNVAAVRMLLARGADPNEPSGANGWTPLLHAVHKNQLGSAAALLAAGADANCADPEGLTPLMMAAGYANDPMVTVLLRRGADVERRNAEGEAALDFALNGMTDPERFTFFRCNDSTAALLVRRVPSLRSTAKPSARRWARMKGCAVTG